MQQKMVVSVVVVMLMTGMVALARADELSDLRQMVENQYNELIKVQNRLIALEAVQKEQGVAVQRLESDNKRGFAIPETLSWVENIKFYGDFRYRYEYIDWDTSAGKNVDRDRNRIRARIGMKARVNDEFAFDLRVATGSSDPVSTNQTLGAEDEKEFGSREIWLDRAYVTYTPASIEGLTVLAGKFGTPFYRAGGNQLIWDDDLNPEGVAVQYTRKLSDNTSAFGNFGYMIVEENKNGDYGLELYGIQGGLEHVFDDSTLTYGAGYFEYANTQGHAVLGNGAEGNTTMSVPTGNFVFDPSTGNPVAEMESQYVYNYKLLEFFGDYTTKMGELPLELYGDYVVNTASGVSKDTGWLIGTKLGKARDIGSSQFGYEYRDLDRDCVLGTFNDSDFIDGGTGGKGHKFSYAYQLGKNTQLGATYFCSERAYSSSDDEKDDSYRRLQLDFIVKF